MVLPSETARAFAAASIEVSNEGLGAGVVLELLELLDDALLEVLDDELVDALGSLVLETVGSADGVDEALEVLPAVGESLGAATAGPVA